MSNESPCYSAASPNKRAAVGHSERRHNHAVAVPREDVKGSHCVYHGMRCEWLERDGWSHKCGWLGEELKKNRWRPVKAAECVDSPAEIPTRGDP